VGIPVKNIYGFFTKEPEEPNCEQIELHEDFLNDIVEFHFENGVYYRVLSLPFFCFGVIG